MKKLLMSLVCLLMVFTLVGCGTNNSNKKGNEKIATETDTETETNESVTLEPQVVNDLTFEHFAITKDSDDISIVYFDITNKTNKDIDVKSVTFTLYDNDDELLSLKVDINETIEAGATKTVTENFDISMPNVDGVKYTVE